MLPLWRRDRRSAALQSGPTEGLLNAGSSITHAREGQHRWRRAREWCRASLPPFIDQAAGGTLSFYLCLGAYARYG